MKIGRSGLIVLVVLACAPTAFGQAPAAAPSAEALAEAKRHYDLGRKLYDERDYDAAFAELTRAYEIAPTPNLFYNLGLVHVARRDYAAALGSLQSYLAQASAIAPERRQEVEALIETAKGRVATLEIKVAEADTDVFVDDALIGKTPLEKPIFVNAGEHRVRISKEGRLAARSVIVTGGEKRALELAFESAPAPLTAPTPTRAPEVVPTKPAEAAGPPLWIGWVATGALAAGATFTGLRAISKQNELDDQSHERGVTRAELDSTHKQMKTYAAITDLLVVAAVATGGVTLYLSLKRGSREGTAARAYEIGVGPGSAAFRGRF